MNDRRIVITGLGVIAPNGIGKEKFWESIKNGVSGIKKITRFDASKYPAQIAGEINNFDPYDYIPTKQIKRMHRVTQFAIAASKLALNDSKILISEKEAERIGIIMGTSIGGQGWIYNQHLAFLKGGYRKINPFTSIAVYPNACSAEVSISLGIKGPSQTFSFGCSSSLSAVGFARYMIKSNLVDVMLIGGAEAPLESPIFAALCRSGNLSTSRNNQPEKASRPFDKERDGLVVSEGAGVFIIEELQHALRRKAHIYAEIIGWGETCDAYHPFRPHPDAIQPSRAIELALQDSGCGVDDIDYICALGLSLPLTDLVETKAIKKVFKKYAYKIPISSIKSMIGQPFAAAGALQIITTALALDNGLIPPTINYEFPDPECDLDYVPHKSRQIKINYALTETFAFGGKNVVLILKRYEG